MHTHLHTGATRLCCPPGGPLLLPAAPQHCPALPISQMENQGTDEPKGLCSVEVAVQDSKRLVWRWRALCCSWDSCFTPLWAQGMLLEQEPTCALISTNEAPLLSPGCDAGVPTCSSE